MARTTIDVLDALRLTADHLERSDAYQWGHMGSCNCGFLAQQVTHLTNREIHSRALLGHGDWNEQLNDYCSTSGLPFDGIISALLDFGCDIDDLKHLERLSDPRVTKTIVGPSLSQNNKADVVLYLRHWAQALEESLLEKVVLSLEDAVAS